MLETIIETPKEGGETITGTKAWLTSVPEEFRGHEVFQTIEKPSEVYSRLIDLTEKSKGMFRIPGEGATEDEVMAFNKAMGIPNTADAYEIARPTDLPEGMPYDEAREASFKEVAHKLKLTPAQVAGLMQFDVESAKSAYARFDELNKEAEAAVTKTRTDTELALKKEWGDKYDENLNLAKRVARNLGGEELIKFAESPENGYPGLNPHFLKFVAKIGTLISEDKLGFEEAPGESQDRPRDPVTKEPMLKFNMGKKN